MREAGDRTTWTEPDAGLRGRRARRGRRGLRRPARCAAVARRRCWPRIAGPGWTNALAAKLLALTMPGVPDVYQGSELWEQSLVDPDNRRPVDFDRARPLRRLAPARAHRRRRRRRRGQAAVTRAALTLRRDRPELFTSYDAADRATGAAADHVLAFDRGGAITVVTRLPVGLAGRGGWGDTALDLPAGSWRDAADRAHLRPDACCSPTCSATTPSPCWSEEDMMTRGRFDVWAPRPDDACGCSVGDDVVPMRRDDDGWWTPAGRSRCPTGEVDYGYLLDDDADAACRTRGRGGSPTACTSCRARSTPRRTSGATAPGPAGSSPAR